MNFRTLNQNFNQAPSFQFTSAPRFSGASANWMSNVGPSFSSQPNLAEFSYKLQMLDQILGAFGSFLQTQGQHQQSPQMPSYDQQQPQAPARPVNEAPTTPAPPLTPPPAADRAAAPNRPAPAANQPAQGQQLPQGWGSYSLQYGDTIWDLAVTKGKISLEDFQKHNPGVDLNNYKSGQSVNLPAAALAQLDGWKPQTPRPRSSSSNSAPSQSAPAFDSTPFVGAEGVTGVPDSPGRPATTPSAQSTPDRLIAGTFH